MKLINTINEVYYYAIGILLLGILWVLTILEILLSIGIYKGGILIYYRNITASKSLVHST